jgi:long-subunit fatty acid transport protein
MRFLLIIFILAYLPVSAQYKIRTVDTDFIRQGMITLGGSLSFSTQTFETSRDSRTVLNFTPALSYFLFPKFSAGVAVQLNNLSVAGHNTTDWGIGPSIRYYFNNKRFAPFFGGGVSYGSSTSSETDDKFTTSRIILTVGADYFIVKNVAAEMNINYMFVKDKYPDRYADFLTSTEFYSRQAVIALGVNIFI